MKKQKNENVSYLSEVLDKLKEHKMAMAGLVVLIVEILMVVFLPMSPEAGSLYFRLHCLFCSSGRSAHPWNRCYRT